MTDEKLLEASTEYLKETKDSLYNEMQALRNDINSIEIELFYRINPECRPPQITQPNQI